MLTHNPGCGAPSASSSPSPNPTVPSHRLTCLHGLLWGAPDHPVRAASRRRAESGPGHSRTAYEPKAAVTRRETCDRYVRCVPVVHIAEMHWVR